MENILELKLKELNVTHDELRQKFGHEISHMIQLKLNFVGSTSYSLLNETRLSYIGDYGLCYLLPFDKAVYLHELDYTEVFANMSFFRDESDPKILLIMEGRNTLFFDCLFAYPCHNVYQFYSYSTS